MKTTTILSSLLLILTLFAGCEDEESDYERQVRIDTEKIKKYLADENIDAKEALAGYYYEKVKEDTDGEAISRNDVVAFYYSMSLLDGSELDSYMDTLQPPLLFKQGVGSLWPEGLDNGVGKMRVGEHYRFYLPSYLAYYDYSHSDYFPTFSNFIIDIQVAVIATETEIEDMELDSIKSFIAQEEYEDVEEYASGLFYIETEEGDGNKPSKGDGVTIHFTRKYLDGTVIETTGNDPTSFYIGGDRAVEGLQDGIRLMKEGGEAILIMPSKIAFGKSLQILPLGLREELYEENILLHNVAPYSPVLYEVELVDVKII